MAMKVKKRLNCKEGLQ
uniref:Uncharacterized protein n=1 Tax=Rhizophora mucronata TaxID=61149 RepID=A0A2P2NEI3_RHIMU